MRTAKEILGNYTKRYIETIGVGYESRNVIRAINVARKEALTEAMKSINPTENPLVARQKIAELINELKK